MKKLLENIKEIIAMIVAMIMAVVNENHEEAMAIAEIMIETVIDVAGDAKAYCRKVRNNAKALANKAYYRANAFIAFAVKRYAMMAVIALVYMGGLIATVTMLYFAAIGFIYTLDARAAVEVTKEEVDELTKEEIELMEAIHVPSIEEVNTITTTPFTPLDVNGMVYVDFGNITGIEQQWDLIEELLIDGFKLVQIDDRFYVVDLETFNAGYIHADAGYTIEPEYGSGLIMVRYYDEFFNDTVAYYTYDQCIR